MQISSIREKKLAEFANKFGLNLDNYENLNTAFVHPSYLNDHKIRGAKSYEVLEFLGDADISFQMII